MASSPTVLSQPIPLRSPDSADVDLHHPTPDLQSLQGAYVGNIERLEDHAERMSEAGSDLGEEIRKLQLEQKLSDSRRSSLHSGVPIEEVPRQFDTRSRNASTSSYSNSIVDVNVAARWGGYSPGGYVTSPVGSLRSGSFSHQLPLQRQRSSSKTSRLGQVVHQEEEEEDMQSPSEYPGSPQSYRSVPKPARRDSSPPASHRSVSSFTRRYDQIAQEIQEELNHSPVREGYGHHGEWPQDQPHHDPHYLNPHELPDRPSTAASTDTTRQMRDNWHDFDGSHAPDTVIEEEENESRGSGSRQSSIMRSAPELPPQGAPPPEDGMVFYPAPVPKLLNLPKRLSQVPSANIQARRRTQLLETMQAENRKSTSWVDAAESSKPNRKSMMNLEARKSRQSLAGLPPQLRASAYFDQVGPAQDFDVKGESAEATLESILEASAHAPVNTFVDHPFGGHLGGEVYGQDKHERKTSKSGDLGQTDKRKSPSSLNLLDTRRNSSGDLLNKLKKRNSSGDLLTVRANESRMSLGTELDEPDHDARGPDADGDATPTGRTPEDDVERSGSEDGEGHEEESEEQHFGPPTTLLAELQMRKAQQKNRNLNAATAFTTGIHATLLELDAVAEVEKKKRQRHKVNLAWEAAPEGHEDDSDDDVPLGMLFPGGRGGLVNRRPSPGNKDSDWDKPLGLIAQKELEDNEPLSRRKARLTGVSSNRATMNASPGKRQTQYGSQQHLPVPTSGTPQPESEEDEGETLGQRLRRLKDRKELDNALGADIRKSTVSGDFASEMMSQFGMPSGEASKSQAAPAPTPSPGPDGEEETLGQRRARLQAEAIARGDANPLGSRPPLRTSMSMANVLGANPLNVTHEARKVSNEQLLSSLPQGSLLHQSAMDQSRREADRIDRNRRISSYGHGNIGTDQPLLGRMNEKRPDQGDRVGANIQAYKDKLSGVGTPNTAPLPSMPSMMFSPMGGMSNMNIPGQRDSYFPQPNTGMGMNASTPNLLAMQNASTPNLLGMPGMPGMNGMGAMNPMGMPMMQQAQPMMDPRMSMMGMPMNGMQLQQGMMNPYMIGGMRQSSMMSLPMQGGMMQQPMMMEPPMDPRQRSMIDQWRNGVA